MTFFVRKQNSLNNYLKYLLPSALLYTFYHKQTNNPNIKEMCVLIYKSTCVIVINADKDNPVQCKTINCTSDCLENQFCDKSLGKCKTCGPCFDTYNKRLRSEIQNFTAQTSKVVHKYEIDLNELTKNITELAKIKEVSVKDLNNLVNLTKIIQTNSEQISNKLKHVQNKISRLRDEISNYKVNRNVTQNELIDKIKQEVKTIESFLLLIKNITFNADYVNEVSKINVHLGEINKELSPENNLLNISNVSFNIAFSVEHDLDLIELITNTYNSSLNVNDPYADKLRTNVEQLLRIISGILNDYYEMSKLKKKIEKLQKTSSLTWENAKNQKSSLEQLLSKYDSYIEYLEILRNEEAFFKKLKKLSNEHTKAINEFKEAQKDVNIFRQDVDMLENKFYELNHLTLEYSREFNETSMSLTLNQDELNELLGNATKAYEDVMININNENFTLGYFYDDIAKMTTQAANYEKHFLNYCK